MDEKTFHWNDLVGGALTSDAHPGPPPDHRGAGDQQNEGERGAADPADAELQRVGRGVHPERMQQPRHQQQSFRGDANGIEPQMRNCASGNLEMSHLWILRCAMHIIVHRCAMPSDARLRIGE